MARVRTWRAAGMLVLALIVASCGGGTQTGQASRLPLASCLVQQVQARCGMLQVPENPANPKGKQISLRVVVIPAKVSNPAPDALFYFAGGPGGAASDATQWAYTHFNVLNQRHDIVLIDQRGTGASNNVTCSLNPSSASQSVADLMNGCLSSIKNQADPKFYSTPIAVDDFDRVRAALGYDKIDVYGISYGVSSGLDYVQRHGDHVRTAVFDSGSLLDVHLWELIPTSAQHSLDAVFARCAADTTCAAAFPNLKTDFAAVMARVTRAPIPTQIVDPTSGGFLKMDVVSFLNILIDGYLKDARSAAALPRDVHAAANGDWSAFLDQFTKSVGGGGNSTQIMFITIACSDEWAVLDPTTINRIGAGSAFTPQALSKAATNNAGCQYWPKVAGASGAVKSSAPIVFLNGMADPVDPPANVAASSSTMPNGLVVPIAGFGHGTIQQDPTGCLAEKSQSFIEAGKRSRLSDWNCPGTLPSFLTS